MDEDVRIHPQTVGHCVMFVSAYEYVNNDDRVNKVNRIVDILTGSLRKTIYRKQHTIDN